MTSPAGTRPPAPGTHLAILAVPRLSGADGREGPTSYRCCRAPPERELPAAEMTKASTAGGRNKVLK